MTRFLLAGALVAGAFLTSAPAHACTIDTCPILKPACDRVNCAHPVCFETPEIAYCP